MAEVNLLASYPKTKRNIKSRFKAKTPELVKEACKFGELYFDGPREYGYGGYSYDGRWIPIAKKIVEHFNLKPGMRVLDVGCAKGFLVKDLLNVCPGLEVFGIDISEYALKNCEPEVVGRLHLGSADSLPFPDKSFDALISINTLHNLSETRCIDALKEFERLASGRCFVQVDSYYTQENKSVFEQWVLTAKFHGYPEIWKDLFEKAKYTGDYFWTIVE